MYLKARFADNTRNDVYSWYILITHLDLYLIYVAELHTLNSFKYTFYVPRKASDLELNNLAIISCRVFKVTRNLNPILGFCLRAKKKYPDTTLGRIGNSHILLSKTNWQLYCHGLQKFGLWRAKDTQNWSSKQIDILEFILGNLLDLGMI